MLKECLRDVATETHNRKPPFFVSPMLFVAKAACAQLHQA